jgi:D-alanine-D-alanine ligase
MNASVGEPTKLRVAVLFGGRSGEHEISLLSARSVMEALDPNRYEIIQIGITHQGEWLVGEGLLEKMSSASVRGLESVTMLPDPTRDGIYKISPPAESPAGDQPGMTLFSDVDVVFPVLHGTFGEDGTIQGLFELNEMAYVGAGVLGSSVGMDKGVFKEVMRARGIPVLDYRLILSSVIEKEIQETIRSAEKMAPYPLFVKPANLGSSVGVSKCRNRSDLLEGLMEASRFDRRVLVERGVEAREIEISVLGNEDPQASIPGEVVPAADYYSYQAKYHDERSQLLIPAPISEEMVSQVKDLALRAYRAIDCAGMARVDFLLEKTTDRLYLNELNTIPGFTKISMYPKLWEASGLSYPQLVDRLIELAMERKSVRDRIERRYDVS